jgi:polygalacturonase
MRKIQISMRRPRLLLLSWPLFAAIFVFLGPLHAQDTRTVTEPAFPAICKTLQADLQQTGNVLPPADEMLFDTSRIQTALSGCTSGEAVELATGSSGANAFLIQPISIPAGVTLLVDAGVTVYGSRNPRDYDAVANECGTVASYSNGCNPLISVNANNAGIMGYGVIDGRGGQTLIVSGTPSTTTWWQLATQAQTASLNQNNPRLLNVNASNFTLYKITLQNSPFFHVNYQGNGLTVWDVKIIAPGTARNTDGIDPGPAQNVTITQSYIGEGDDNIALKPGGNAVTGGTVTDISVLHNHFYVGHGMSIGSQTSGGTTNVLVQDLNIDGDPTNGADTGIRIKAESSDGGLINGVTYKQVCMQNVADPIQFNPFYSTSTGSDIPQFQNITLSNVTDLTAGSVLLEGYSANYPLGLTLDNVNFTPALPAADLSASNANITLGPGPVNLPVSTSSTHGVTVTSNITTPTESPYACTSANFPLLATELFGSASQLTAGQPLTLTAIFEPVIESPTTLVATEPTQMVTFYDGTTSVGTATLSGTSDLVTLTLPTETPGTHVYTAVYSGDSNYSTVTTPSFTVTVNGSTTTTLSVSPLTVNAGQTVQLTAMVTATGGTPAGTVTFFDGTTPLSTPTLNNGSATYTATLSAGTHNLTASYTANGGYLGSASTAQTVYVQDFTITASPSTLTLGPGSTGASTLTVTILGGLTGTVAFSCTGLPVYVSCSASPLSLSGTGSSTAVLTISVAATLASVPAIWLLLAPLLALLGGAKKRRGVRLTALAGILLLGGCGGASTSPATTGSTPQVPPAGQQTGTVTATTNTSAGALSHTVTVTVNVL